MIFTMDRMFQAGSLIFSYFFFQSMGDSQIQLVSEGIKLGFAVLFLLMALIYIWKDWRRERDANDKLNTEIKDVINLYHSAMKGKDDSVNSLVKAIREQNKSIITQNNAITERNKNLEILNQSIMHHNEMATKRSEAIESLTATVAELVRKIGKAE